MNSFSQEFASKDYYLVDSLNLSELSVEDIAILEQSLKKYHKSENSLDKIIALNDICEGLFHDIWIDYQFFQYDLIQKALSSQPSEKDKKKLNKYLAIALNNIGYIEKLRGNIELALNNYRRALKMQEKLGDKERQAQILNNIGVIQKNQGNIPMALASYHKALKIQEKLDDQLGMASSYFNIGSTHQSLKNYDVALSFYRKSLKVNSANGRKRGISNDYNNIGVVFREKNEPERALEYFKKSAEIKKEIGENTGLVDVYINMGTIYEDLEKLALAYEYYTKAIELSEANNNAKGLSNAYIKLAGLKFNSGDPKETAEALHLAESGLRIARDLGFPDRIRDASAILLEIYESQGKFNNALEMHKLYVQMKDSISNLENQREISRRQAQYEYETQKALDDKEHEKQIEVEKEEQEKQKILAYVFAIGSIFLVGFLIYAVNRLKITRKQKRTIEEQKEKVDKAYEEVHLEKRKSDELLLNILPEEVAEELKTKGAADARLMEKVTVLFTDFKGFTKLAEQMSAKQLVREINTCFSAFDQIMEKHRVEKIKTIGDAYMAAGGLPVANETHAQDVVNAALEIQNYMQKYAEEKRAKNELFFEIRIGIHTGPVVAGIVGVKKFQYDIWGDTVNTASRLESSSGPGKVNISAVTYELIRNNSNLRFESRGAIDAKGKGKLQMYFVERSN